MPDFTTRQPRKTPFFGVFYFRTSYYDFVLSEDEFQKHMKLRGVERKVFRDFMELLGRDYYLQAMNKSYA